AAQITAVDPGGPAEQAGVQPGDAILALEGESWDGFSRLQSILHAKQFGDSLRVTVETESGTAEERHIPLRLPREEPESASVITDDDDERYVGALGLTAQEITLSNVAAAIERRVRVFIPVRRGAIISGIALALNNIF